LSKSFVEIFFFFENNIYIINSLAQEVLKARITESQYTIMQVTKVGWKKTTAETKKTKANTP